MNGRRLSLLHVFTVFYEQLSWTPVLVVLAADLGDTSVVALAASAYSLSNLGGNLVFGYLADRVGRLWVAGFGLMAMAFTSLLHVSASSPDGLVGARFLHGLAIATVAPAAFAAISDGAPAGKRGEAMARAGLVIAIASMLAPSVTGRLSVSMGVDRTIYAQALVLALVGIVTLLAIGMGGAQRVRRKEAGAPVDGARPFNASLAMTAALVAFVLMFGQNVLFYALPVKSRELGLDPAVTGGILSTFAIGSIAAFVPPLSRVADRWGRKVPVLLGLILVATACLLLAFLETAFGLALGMLVYGLGFGLVFPAVSALSADASGTGQRGLAYGFLTAAFSLGSITGPLLTRTLDGRLSPFSTTAIVVSVGVLVTALVYRQAPLPVVPPHGRAQ